MQLDFILTNINRFILRNKHQGRWWPGDAVSRGISSHDIDRVLTVFLSLKTRGDNLYSYIFRAIYHEGIFVPEYTYIYIHMYIYVHILSWRFPNDIELFSAVKGYDIDR